MARLSWTRVPCCLCNIFTIVSIYHLRVARMTLASIQKRGYNILTIVSIYHLRVVTDGASVYTADQAGLEFRPAYATY
jgi:hypothetical protein